MWAHLMPRVLPGNCFPLIVSHQEFSMNVAQVNAFRVANGLATMVVDTVAKAVQAKRQASNKAARAAESRDIKSRRGSRSK